MRTIHCRHCNNNLPVADFRGYPHVRDVTKISSCKRCESRRSYAWNLAHPERVKANKEKCKAKDALRLAHWGRNNRAHLTEYMRGYRERNREKIRKINNECRVRYPEKVAAWKVEYQARKRTQVPPWADMSAIKAVYFECGRLTRETGIPHHVDHIFPLKGKNMCGLHVETNLQILTAVENLKKMNKVQAGAD